MKRPSTASWIRPKWSDLMSPRQIDNEGPRAGSVLDTRRMVVPTLRPRYAGILNLSLVERNHVTAGSDCHRGWGHCRDSACNEARRPVGPQWARRCHADRQQPHAHLEADATYDCR